MRRTKSGFVAALFLFALLLWPGTLARAQQISGCSLSNFDVTNTDDRAYDDFELVLLGRVNPECITRWYPGWGAPPVVRADTRFGPGVTITWRDRRNPVRPGETRHFGIDLRCDGGLTARAFWSQGGSPVREVPVPWQSWRTQPGAVVDVIRLAERVAAPRVAVQRESVALREPIPLERLNWKDVDAIVEKLGLDWRLADRRPRLLAPGGEMRLELPVRPGDRAALVRYTVTSGNRVLTRFVNQACLDWGDGIGCPPGLPKPRIEVTGREDYAGSDGNPYTRYRIAVTNRADYPDGLFAAAPDLPACGLNANSSRTWVEMHDGNGTRLNGFCALSSAAELGDLWFAVPRGTPPPACVSVTLIDRRCERSYQSDCAPVTGGPPCIDFESLAAGTTYATGSTFTDSGATMDVRQFQWANGSWTATGQARVDNAGQAGGTGNDLRANNVNVGFQFPAVPNVVFLNFGEYGGNLNLEVNGDFRNFADFAGINGTSVGGAQVAVTGLGGGAKGTLTLTGEVHSLAVGGQELWLDHVCHTAQPPVEHEGTWIMPFGVGGTRLDRIKPTGLTDYTDGISGFPMIDAPFGGSLGFRLGSASGIPTPHLYYYRIQYRSESETAWHDFTETVTVHYVKESPAVPPVFPTLVLGPNHIGGKNLYRFRPHEDELPALVPVAPGETVRWPSTGFLGDIYAGYLNTTGLGLLPGRYHIRFEIYDSAGVQVIPNGTFRFVVPVGAQPDGTILSDFAPPASISSGGYELTLHVDNRSTSALIDEPKIGAVGANVCGFLRYDPSSPANPPHTTPVRVAFHATHPDNHAVFSFDIVRAHTELTLPRIRGAEVAAASAGTSGAYAAYTGDGDGNFTRDFTRGELLEGCIEAAFSQNLYVYAKATTGWSHRIPSLDAHDVFACALTPD